MMASAFAHLSYRQQRNQELLHRLSDGILTLKLEAQGRAGEVSLDAPDPCEKRLDVAAFLADLAAQVRLVAATPAEGAVDLAFSGLADRFVRDAPGGVADRLDQLDRLRGRLLDGDRPLPDRDYRLLDRLQALLEEETAEDVRGLFRL